jgi:pyruvate dehydrogenase E1 component alpha subunit
MPADELAAAEAKDPIPLYRARLLDAGVLSAGALDAIEKEAAERVEAALAEVLASPWPEADELDKDFYADMKGIPA